MAILAKEGYLVDWVNYCEDAVAHGWKLRKAVVGLREAVVDTYDKQWVKEWDRKMIRYIKSLV